MGKCQGQNDAGNEHDPRGSCLACPRAPWCQEARDSLCWLSLQPPGQDLVPPSWAARVGAAPGEPSKAMGTGAAQGPLEGVRGHCTSRGWPWASAHGHQQDRAAHAGSRLEPKREGTYNVIQMTMWQCCGHLGMRWDVHQAVQGRCPPLTDTIYPRCPDQTNRFCTQCNSGCFSRTHLLCLLWICGHLLATQHGASLAWWGEVPGFSAAAAAGSCSQAAFHVHVYRQHAEEFYVLFVV